MEQRVRNILAEAFPGIDILIETLPDGRVSGTFIWAGFTGLDHVARQERIGAVLDKTLGPDAQQVGLLLAYTPDELKAMKAA